MKTISPSLITKTIRSTGELCETDLLKRRMERQVFILQSIKQLLTALSGQRERECVRVCYTWACVSLIRASGLLCPLEIKDLKWNLKTERTLARPKSLEQERRREEKRKRSTREKREDAQACERKEMKNKDSLRYLRVSRLFKGLLNRRTRGFPSSRSGLNNRYMNISQS